MDTTAEEFLDAWETGDTPWHMTGINPLFLKHVNTLLAGKDHAKIFVPLCGKEDTLKWLYNAGHEVVGLDVYEKGCEEIFKELNIEYQREKIANIDGIVFKSTGNDKGSLRLYCCNYFLFRPEIEKDFDAVWDRGAFNAIKTDEHIAYVDVLKPLMKPSCINLTEFVKFKGKDAHFSLEDIKRYYGEDYTCEEIERLEPYYEAYNTAVDEFFLYKIKRKDLV